MKDKFSLNTLLGSISKLVSAGDATEKKRVQKALQNAHDDEIQHAILVLVAEVIGGNRNFTANTEKCVHEFFLKQFGVTGKQWLKPALRKHLDTVTASLSKMACTELKLLTTPRSRETIVQFLLGLAVADDFINDRKVSRIQRIAGNLGLSDKEFRELKDDFKRTNNPYAVLGLEPGAPIKQVKAAYRKMVLKFHPDKRGPHFSEKEAGIKFAEIKRAYEMIMSGAAH